MLAEMLAESPIELALTELRKGATPFQSSSAQKVKLLTQLRSESALSYCLGLSIGLRARARQLDAPLARDGSKVAQSAHE